jgi:hypothetical protein
VHILSVDWKSSQWRNSPEQDIQEACHLVSTRSTAAKSQKSEKRMKVEIQAERHSKHLQYRVSCVPIVSTVFNIFSRLDKARQLVEDAKGCTDNCGGT